MVLNYLAFCLPFFLFFSVITNAIGFYVVLVLFAFYYIYKLNLELPKYSALVGFLFLSLHLSFTLTNMFGLFVHNPNVDVSIYTKNIDIALMLVSKFPKSYFFFGLLLILAYFIQKFLLKRTEFHKPIFVKNEYRTIDLLQNFIKGNFWASIFFLFFYVFESFSGISYRDCFYTLLHGTSLNFDRHYSFIKGVWSLRRAQGFFGNTLTLSSMSLGFFAFFYTLYWAKSNTVNFLYAERHLPFYKTEKEKIIYYLIPALSYFFILACTMGRTALVVGIFFLVFLPLFYYKRFGLIKTLCILCGLVILSSFIFYQLGLYDRIAQGFLSLEQTGQMDNRGVFRRIHWQMFLDKPFIGNGIYWLEKGVRDHYFVAMGYANLNERNFAAHNIYLETLACGGLFAAFIIFFSVAKLLTIIRNQITTAANGNRPLFAATCFCLLVNLAHGYTQNNYFEASTTYVYLYLFAVIFWSNIFDSKKIPQ